MPKRNNFKHQIYTDQPPKAPFEVFSATLPPPPGTAGFNQSVKTFSQRIEDKIDAIYISHGTFVGNDALGWVAQIERAIPDSGSKLRQLGKRLTDALTKDSGNFMDGFADLIKSNIPARLFTWSGENVHTGRCRAAIDQLAQMFDRIDSEPRVLLWGHSHAGNIAALITNLIGADEWVRNQFFDLMWPFYPDADDNPLLKVQKSLEDESLKQQLKIDVANFGTPICYGWDTGGYRNLLHIVNHKTNAGTEDYLAPAISITGEGIVGDIAQLLGITGSNFWPYLLTQTTRETEKKIHEFLAPDITRRDYLQRLQMECVLLKKAQRYSLTTTTKTAGRKSWLGTRSTREKIGWHFIWIWLVNDSIRKATQGINAVTSPHHSHSFFSVSRSYAIPFRQLDLKNGRPSFEIHELCIRSATFVA